MKLAAYVLKGSTIGQSGEEQLDLLKHRAEALGVKFAAIEEDEPLRVRDTKGTVTDVKFTYGGLFNLLEQAGMYQAVVVVDPAILYEVKPDLNARKILDGMKCDVVEVSQLESYLQEIAEEPEPESKLPTDADEFLAELSKSDSIAAKLLLGRIEGAKKGFHQSGPPPYGYRRSSKKKGDDTDKLLIPDEVEADMVKYIFRIYLKLKSMKRVVEHLDSKGIKTRRGKQWSRAGISWILRNRTYLGRVKFGTINVAGVHEPLISPIIFNKVNKLIRKNDKKTGHKRQVA